MGLWKSLLEDRQFTVFASLILLVVLLGVVGPMLTHDPRDLVGLPNMSPSGQFLLGTDGLGRDVWVQLLSGIRTSLIIGVFSGSIATLIAIGVGVIAGYKGGLLDEGLSFTTNIMLTLPPLVLLIILAAWMPSRTIWVVGAIIAMTNWPWAARTIRSQVLSLREREFVKLAKITGDRGIKIAILEVLPNIMAYALMLYVLLTNVAILTEAGISMMGLGPTDATSLGTMLFWSIQIESLRSGFWWIFIPPGLILTLITSCMLGMHSRMDEAFNPRLRKW